MRKLFLAILSGLLFAFSWSSIGLFPLILVAFIPLLILEKESENGKQVFWHAFFAFFIFNAITTYWVYHASLFGAIAAFIVNATLMASSFWLFHKIKSVTTKRLGYLSFIVMWIAMEYLHLNWDLSWPWLTLGNVFSNAPYVVQWYEFTGFLGGSLWVLLMNVLLFNLYITDDKKKAILLPLLVLLLPLVVSHHIGNHHYQTYLNFKTEQDRINVLILQPNIDPYTDKFNVGFEKQLDDFIALAKTKLTQETQLLVGPETALLEGIWENRFEDTYSVRKFRELQNDYPNLNVLVGGTTYRMFGHGEQKTTTARQIRNEDVFYDVYNSAVFVSDSGVVEVYHKAKLVPGPEKMPFPRLLDPLAKLAVDLGGTSGSLGSGNSLNNFKVKDINIRPLICYESIYGEMNFNNSNLIAIITNDGWWKNTPGYKQHFSYARLRAIEQRKTIVRSANTGISGVIMPNGEVLEQTKWDEETCISANPPINTKTTFYAQFGNYIGRLSLFVAFMLMIVAFVKGRLRK